MKIFKGHVFSHRAKCTGAGAHKYIKLYRTDAGGSGVLIFCEALDLFCVRTRLIKFFARVRDEQRD
jgi:hypothetical protein